MSRCGRAPGGTTPRSRVRRAFIPVPGQARPRVAARATGWGSGTGSGVGVEAADAPPRENFELSRLSRVGQWQRSFVVVVVVTLYMRRGRKSRGWRWGGTVRSTFNDVVRNVSFRMEKREKTMTLRPCYPVYAANIRGICVRVTLYIRRIYGVSRENFFYTFFRKKAKKRRLSVRVTLYMRRICGEFVSALPCIFGNYAGSREKLFIVSPRKNERKNLDFVSALPCIFVAYTG